MKNLFKELKKMSKINKRFKVEFNLDWEYGVEIKKIREDLDTLEKLGATHIDLDSEESYGCSYITIEGFVNREETDEEYNIRINEKRETQERIKKRELEQFEKLKQKYGK